MDKTIIDSLQLLGLTDKEIQFFSLCLEYSPTTTSHIAKLARLQRSSAYLILDSLVAKGLITKEQTNYSSKLFPITPRNLKSLLRAKRKQLFQVESRLKKSLPSLEATYSTSVYKPKIRVYQGENGLRTVWQDILTAKKETLIITNQQAEQKVFTRRQHDNFIEDRISHKIFAKVLALDNPEGEKLKSGDPIFYRQTKLFKSDNFTAETYIYNDKVAILDCDQDIIGIIIQSPTIVKTYQSIFHSLWQIS